MLQRAESIAINPASCVISPLMVQPHSNRERLTSLPRLVKEGKPVEIPVVFKIESGFEVIYGWDVVSAHSEAGIRSMPAILVPAENQLKVSWAVIEQARLLNLSWVHVALGLNHAKRLLNVTVSELAKLSGLSRTRVSRYINISSRLHPKLLDLAKLGHLTFSDCRELLTLPITTQESLVIQSQGKAWTNQQLMDTAFPERRVAPSPTPGSQATGSHEHPQTFEKSMDTKRMEAMISEKVGFPVELEPGDAKCHAGTIHYQFFDSSSMVDLARSVQNGFRHGARPQGRISITFTNLDELDGLIGKFFQEEF